MMDNLFDIAHSLGKIKTEVDKNFWKLQCQKRESGCMFDVDHKLKHKGEQALKFNSIEPVRGKKWLM